MLISDCSSDVCASDLRTPAGELTDKVRSTVGDKMTKTEKAATNVLDRTAENEAISPFTPGVGTEHHMARMDDAARRLNDPEAPPVEPAPAVDPREVVKAQIRQVESSGAANHVPIEPTTDRKNAAKGQSVSVRLDPSGRRI